MINPADIRAATRTIEYLDVYREALAHQQTHHDPAYPSFAGGISQPSEFCLQCLTERTPQPPLHEAVHGVKMRFSWAVPNEAALDMIRRYSPNGVVEVGAGGGYWAMLLRERGVDVVAYDPDPAGTDEDPWHDGRAWSEVLPGDHAAAADHPERTLFLCWPSYNQGWGAQAIEAYGGDTVIYIGEGPGGCTGDDRLDYLLGLESPWCEHRDEPCTCVVAEALFTPVDSLAIPQWHGIHDGVTVHQRCGVAGGGQPEQRLEEPE